MHYEHLLGTLPYTVYETTTCDVRGKIEMESRCVEDELDSECILYSIGTSIIHNNE